MCREHARPLWNYPLGLSWIKFSFLTASGLAFRQGRPATRQLVRNGFVGSTETVSKVPTEVNWPWPNTRLPISLHSTNALLETDCAGAFRMIFRQLSEPAAAVYGVSLNMVPLSVSPPNSVLP